MSNKVLSSLPPKLRTHGYVEAIGWDLRRTARLFKLSKRSKCWECLLVRQFWRISDFPNTFSSSNRCKFCGVNASLLRAVRKNLSEIWVGIVLMVNQIFLFRYWTCFGHSTVTQSNDVSNFAFVISNGNSLCVFEIFKIDVRSSEVLQSWNKNIWLAMAWCPLGISKEKSLSLLRLKAFDPQNRSETFQLLAHFAIKISERSTP